MKDKNKDKILCDYCKREAVKNYQKIWISWECKNGEYSENPELEFDIEEPHGDENVHVCKKHEEDFLNGDL